eukprot:450813_1
MSKQMKPEATTSKMCTGVLSAGQHDNISVGSTSISPAPISPSNSSQSSRTLPEVSSSIAPTECSDDDWDSDRTLSDAEMLREHIFGAKRFRSAEESVSSESTIKPSSELSVAGSSKSFHTEPSQTSYPNQAGNSGGISSKRPVNSVPLGNHVSVKREKISKIDVNSSKIAKKHSKYSHKSFPTRNNLQKRVRTKKYSCVECSLKCDMRIDLDIHMREVHGGYKCEICIPDRQFPLSGAMESHMKRNVCNRFKCTQCEMAFWSVSIREAHFVETHGSHTCLKCQNPFTTFVTLDKHLRLISCDANQDVKPVHAHIPVADMFGPSSVDNDNVSFPGITLSSGMGRSSVSSQQIPGSPQISSKNVSIKTETSFGSSRPNKRPDIQGYVSQTIVKRQRISNSLANVSNKSSGVSSSSISVSSSSTGASSSSSGVSSSSTGVSTSLTGISSSSTCVSALPAIVISSSDSPGVSALPAIVLTQSHSGGVSTLQCGISRRPVNAKNSSTGQHKCDKCHSSFSRPAHLKRHIKSASCESNSKLMSCGECSINFRFRAYLVAHRREVHRLYRCDICESRFSKLDSLKRHVQNIHMRDVQGGYKCDKCQGYFSRRDALKFHILNVSCVSNSSLLQCEECSINFRFQAELITHMQDVHGGYKCHICSRIFQKKQNLKRHTKNIHVNGGYSCDKCGRALSNRESLKRHIKNVSCEAKSESPSSHMNLRTLWKHCEECDMKYLLRWELDSHVGEVHGGYKCNICVPTRRFANINQLKCHLKRNNCMRWRCGECGLRFLKQPFLITHVMDVHQGYKCDKCGTRLRGERQLKIHVARNSCSQSSMSSQSTGGSIKSESKTSILYACGECSITLKSCTQMDKHMQQAHGGYKCKVCVPTKSFTHFWKLSHHISLSMCMKFQCSKCDMRFSVEYALRVHVNEIHSTHTCQVCKGRFANAVFLKRHLDKNTCQRNQCHDCLMNFQSKRLLKQHINQVHRETEARFGCGVCESKFENRSLLDRHMSRVHGGYKCGMCPDKFTCFMYLRRHHHKTNHV